MENTTTIHYHVICDNDEHLLHYAIEYWKLYANHVFVYLLETSTDGSEEILNKYPDFISVLKINSKTYNKKIDQTIINSGWKASKGKCDYCFIGYVNDILYFSKFDSEVNLMKSFNMSIYIPKKIELLENYLNENDNKYIHNKVNRGYLNLVPNNPSFFINPNKIDDLNYSYLTQNINPVGDIKYFGGHKSIIFDITYICFNKYLDNIKNKRLYLDDNFKSLKLNYDYEQSDENLEKKYHNKLNNTNLLNIFIK